MSQLIERNASLLHFLGTCKNRKQRNAIINLLTEEQLNAIAECNHNVIKGTVPLSKAQLTSLKRKRKELLDLDEDHDLAHLQGTERRKAKQAKRKAILQQGGLLPLLLAPVLGAIIKGAIISPMIQSGVNAVKSRIKARGIRKIHERQHKETVKRLQLARLARLARQKKKNQKQHKKRK